MKILLLVLIVIIIYLVREITILKSNISNISNQNTQTTNKLTGSSRPQLLFWRSEVSPNGKYKTDSYTGDYADRYHYYQVFITELATDKVYRIYSGDYRTLGLEWTKDNRIKISYDCGTGCLATKVMDINDNIVLTERMISKKNGWEVKFFDSLAKQ